MARAEGRGQRAEADSEVPAEGRFHCLGGGFQRNRAVILLLRLRPKILHFSFFYRRSAKPETEPSRSSSSSLLLRPKTPGRAETEPHHQRKNKEEKNQPLFFAPISTLPKPKTPPPEKKLSPRLLPPGTRPSSPATRCNSFRLRVRGSSSV
ncbi:hypothetical protein TIFTF001_045944 [Ficus carica]|uniref:Uncharacterized protein n=1 Tax=Ficus carica TaxID=3494 RepID=A0AA87Z4V4_FICCA|nr:hypothetical protein TIFTF001_045944 [Ficus carica]